MRTMRWAAALAALCLIGAGCGSDDDGDNNGTPRPTATTRPTNTPGGATPTLGAGATATPTFTPVSGPTNTPGGGGPGAPTVQRFVSSVLGSIASLSDFAGGGAAALRRGAAIQIPPIAIPCTNGGTLSTGCTPDAGGSQLSFTFAGCRNRGGGAETFLDGRIAIDSPAGCPGVPLPVGQPFGVVVDARIEASGGGSSTAGDFDVTETVTFGADGSATVDAEGTVDTDCTGSVSFETLAPLFYPAGAECGTAGEMRVRVGDESHRITLTAGGGVELDYGDDGSVDESFARCTDAGLAQCS